jgi:hypothetical protein
LFEKIDITGLILEVTRRVDESKRTFTEISPAKNAREYARAKVSLPCSMLTVQGPLEGEVRDISLTGALIHCHELPNPDSPIPMAIEIPEQHHSIFATGEMIRLDIEDGEREDPSSLLGIRFAEISEEDLSFLSRKVLHEKRRTVSDADNWSCSPKGSSGCKRVRRWIWKKS